MTFLLSTAEEITDAIFPNLLADDGIIGRRLTQ